MSRIQASAWPHYGGSYRLVRELIGLIPIDTKLVVEPFCGSAVFSINVPWLPRVLNDVDLDVVHLLRVIRERPFELQSVLGLTPYHRGEFKLSVSDRVYGDCEIERARRIFVRFGMARGGGGQEVKGHDWSRSRTEVRRGMMGAVAKFRSRVASLDMIGARLASVQFECVDFERLRRYDSPNTFWFFDPPWEPELRVEGAGERYVHEFKGEDYGRLVGFVKGLKGRVLLIGYDGGLLGEGLNEWGKVEFQTTLSAGQGRGKRIVTGWMNYEV